MIAAIAVALALGGSVLGTESIQVPNWSSVPGIFVGIVTREPNFATGLKFAQIFGEGVTIRNVTVKKHLYPSLSKCMGFAGGEKDWRTRKHLARINCRLDLVDNGRSLKGWNGGIQRSNAKIYIWDYLRRWSFSRIDEHGFELVDPVDHSSKVLSASRSRAKTRRADPRSLPPSVSLDRRGGSLSASLSDFELKSKALGLLGGIGAGVFNGSSSRLGGIGGGPSSPPGEDHSQGRKDGLRKGNIGLAPRESESFLGRVRDPVRLRGGVIFAGVVFFFFGACSLLIGASRLPRNSGQALWIAGAGLGLVISITLLRALTFWN